LVDTSGWINHFKGSDTHLVTALENNAVVIHPHVIGEIALGSLKNRTNVIEQFYNLPSASIASEVEVHQMIERQKLYSRGIGYTDVHLLAAVLIEGDIKLWTADKRLESIALKLGVGMNVLS